jgi:hypothetical protein
MNDRPEWTEVASRFAQYIRNLLIGQYWCVGPLTALFADLAKAAGFEVSGPVAYTGEDVLSHPGLFPRNDTLSCRFVADSNETAFRATAWLNQVHEAACGAGRRGNQVEGVVLDFIRRIQPIVPIKLTAVGDLLIVPDRHHLQYSGDGYAFILGDMDPPLAARVGIHQGCGGMVSLREGPTSMNRLVCGNGCFAILVGKQAGTYEGLRQDIAMRHLGLLVAGSGSGYVPYGKTARSSIES